MRIIENCWKSCRENYLRPLESVVCTLQKATDSHGQVSQMQNILILIQNGNRNFIYGAVYDTAKRFEELKKSGELQEVLPQIEELCRVKLIQDDTLRMQLWRLTDQIASLIAEEESDCMTIYYKNVTKVWDYQLDKKWFEGTVEMPFENITIAVPSGYDELLTKLYGDYMIPQHKKCGHSYPFYKKQKDYYEKINRVDFSKNK